MLAKINSWEARKLSYAGRLVLVKHVLSAISLYWMRTLPFPQSVIKRIGTICRNYLWSGAAQGRKNLVAWDKVMQRRNEGGLGIKNLGLFNISLRLTQIWNFCLRKESVWVKWLHGYFSNIRNFWETNVKNHMSWQIKQLLRLRNMADICVDRNNEDQILWKGSNMQFTVKGTYALIVGEKHNTEWADLIWCELSPPKHSFCSWLAVQNKLRTKDIMTWKEIEDYSCCWCKVEPESNNHIFFECSSMQALKPLLEDVGRPFRGSSWAELLSWRRNMTWRNSEEKVICSFLINACIYEIWCNRNATIFRNQSLSNGELKKKIWRMMIMKIHSCSDTKKWQGLKVCNFPRNLV